MSNNMRTAIDRSIVSQREEEEKRQKMNKWWDPNFYDELIRKEKENLEAIKRQTIVGKQELPNNTNVINENFKIIAKQSNDYLHQFKEIKKNLHKFTQEYIITLIDPTPPTPPTPLVEIVNFIIGRFEYKTDEPEKIDIENPLKEELLEPLKSDSRFTNAFRMKTSGNQSDCLIHSILINISENFRKLEENNRNTIAFFFRKVIFPLLPGMVDENKERLLVDPTTSQINLELETPEFVIIAMHFKLNFMMISKNENAPINYYEYNNNDNPYFIIYHSGAHFNAVSINNQYGITYAQAYQSTDPSLAGPASYGGPASVQRIFSKRKLPPSPVDCKNFTVGAIIQNKITLLHYKILRVNPDNSINIMPLVQKPIIVPIAKFNEYKISVPSPSHGGYRSKKTNSKKTNSKKTRSKKIRSKKTRSKKTNSKKTNSKKINSKKTRSKK